MLQSRIVNEVNGNYLLIVSNEQNISGFEFKMFEYNNIKGFLPISLVRINNTVTYRYPVMQCQSLAKKFGSEQVSMTDIKLIFSEITLLVHRAEEYLLNMDSVLLNPEFIFISGQELLFCYFPAGYQPFNKSVRELMEYILEKLNHTRQQDVMTAYGLYQKILKNNFTMDGLMDEVFSSSQETEIRQVIRHTETRKDSVEEEKRKEAATENINTYTLEELEIELSGEDKKEKKKKGKWFSWMNKRNKDANDHGTMAVAENMSYGETQILNVKKLQNISGGTDILFSKFPIRIGTSTTESDYVLKNVMVSRKHAVITMECGGYYIEDLDSTNGTFVNGSRISPYEPVLIREGDQICFANEKFCLN